MRAYEFPTKVTPEGQLELPDTLRNLLPNDQEVRVLILVSEPADTDEHAAWSRLAAEQFLAGYADEDAIYDNI